MTQTHAKSKPDPKQAIPNSEAPPFEQLTGHMTRPWLTMITHARTKAGKTWMGLSAPGDIGVLSNDPNCRPICEKYKRMYPDKVIHYAEFLHAPMSQLESTNEVRRSWKAQMDAYYRMLDIKSIRSVLNDTHAQTWADCKTANVGREMIDLSSELDDKGTPTGKTISTRKTMPRDLGEAKREVREMINAAGANNKNLILTCPAEDEWAEQQPGSKDPPRKTGNIRRAYPMPGVEFLTQVEIEQFRDDSTGEFVARLLSSSANPDIRGRKGKAEFDNRKSRLVWVPSPDELIGEDIIFPLIAQKVYPDSDMEVWM